MIPNQLNRLMELAVTNTVTDSNGADTGNNTATNNQLRPMTEEDKQFISAAMDSLCPDYIKILKYCIASLDITSGSNASSHGDKVVAFEELLNHCDNLDVSRDFEKLGGFRVLRDYIDKIFEANDSVLKEGVLALDVLAMCCQLNEYCQEKAIQHELLDRTEKALREALTRLDKAVGEGPVNAKTVMASLKIAFKSLSALSGIVRGNEATIAHYLGVVNGKLADELSTKSKLSLLVTALCVGEMPVVFDSDQDDEADKALPRRIRTKAAFLLRSLINKEESLPAFSETTSSACDIALEMFAKIGAIEKLAHIIANAKEASEPYEYEFVLALLALYARKVPAVARTIMKAKEIAPTMERTRVRIAKWKDDGDVEDDELILKNCDDILQILAN